MSMATNKSITLNLLVDKSRNRVVFAESDGHFVELLLTFLTLPLASILRLTNKHHFGSIHKLLESVENLNSDCFRTEACRSMLLRPVNSAAELLSALPIDYLGDCRTFYYICNNRACLHGCLSVYAEKRCVCGQLMGRKTRPAFDAVAGNGEDFIFLQGSFGYMITDDLFVSQSSMDVTFDLFSKLDIKKGNSLEFLRADLTAEKIHNLLERAMTSDTPLTDVFLVGQNKDHKLQNIKQGHIQSFNTTVGSTESRRISVKLFLNKDENRLLFAEADQEFVDLLMSFLTYPMGSVVNKFEGKSGIQCIDNLYNSIEALKAANCFKKYSQIDKLVKPMLPPHFTVVNPLLNFDVQPRVEYYICKTSGCNSDVFMNCSYYECKTCRNYGNVKLLTLADPKYCSSDGLGGYMKRSRYIITDDLVVNKLSPVMVVTDFLEDAGKGINARKIEIGEQEALLLLQASITSNKVITGALLDLREEGGKRRVRSY